MNVTLDIIDVGARGDGIGELDGQRYFVPYTLPGEVVEAEPVDRRGEGIAARLVEVLAPSRHREAPTCSHFTICGGCSLQHWRLDIYTAWKVDLIDRALKIRGVDAPSFETPVVGAPGERRRADFILRRQGRRVVAGFHERASTRIVDVGTCIVVRPALSWLIGMLRHASLEVLPDGAAADAIVNETDTGLDVLIRPHKRLDLSIQSRQALVALAEQADLARLSWGDRMQSEPVVVRRSPVVMFGDVSVEVPSGAFLQATKRGETSMRAAVASWTRGASRTADLFAGIGTLSLGQSSRVSFFESDGPSVAAIDAVARRTGSNRIEAIRRDLFRNPLMARELAGFEAVVLDPPRAGARTQVAELAASSCDRVVYASCDPGTFARDARTLQDGGYRLEKLMPIDQFLWSTHLELIALFRRP